MLAVSLVIACVLFADVNAGKLIPRIINGDNARIEDYPYQVSLDYDNMHVCGGSIISKHYVLTAAHCFNILPDTEKLSVRVGSSYPSRGGRLHKVTKIFKHKGFSAEQHEYPVNDIAIVKVDKPFQYDAICQPIKLYAANEVTTPGAKAVVTGYGLVANSKPAVQLQSVILSIISKETCTKSYADFPQGQICALGDNGKDSATGDSGGPIAVDGRLAGIVSWGEKGRPSVYTEIAHYRDWIDERVEF